jgi:hypothetical protein
LGFLARRRVVVVLLFVCASTIVGVAPKTVSATRMAIWILRENIYPFFNCDLIASELLNGEKGAIARARSPSNLRTACRLEYTREEGIFPRSNRNPPHQEYEWLSGNTIFCGKA